ncbi:MAG: GNAT family N-acetyltransferase [Candidatus Aenigmatarchaeota archaeon]
MSDFKINPLSKRKLESTLRMLHRVYPIVSDDESFDKALPSSLDPKKYRHVFEEMGVDQGRYWVASKKTRVAGIVGLYSYEKDKDALWVGWFGVSPRYRGQEIGKRLLDYVIKKAEKGDKRYLRLWTSTDPNEQLAHVMYEKRGFVKTDEGPLEGSQFKKLIYELDLDKIRKPKTRKAGTYEK